MVKWAITSILLLPLAEIAVFVIIVLLVGWLWALALMLLTSLAGLLILRRAGRRRIARLRVAVIDSDMTGIEANTGGFLTVIAGLLLFLPGFLTDALGAALLIGPVRRWFAATLRRMAGNRGPAHSSVIDLAPSEWRQVPERKPKAQSGRDDAAAG
jgi:UPF0716 protein FxsA